MSRLKVRPTVLIVEDGAGTRELSRLILESHGFSCLSAETVEVALNLIQDTAKIDVLFSDIHFPGTLSGLDLAQAAMTPPHHIPTLLTSGLAIDYLDEILPDGVAFLEKPYSPEALLVAVRSVMAPLRFILSKYPLSAHPRQQISKQ